MFKSHQNPLPSPLPAPPKNTAAQVRLALRTHLTSLRPVELVLPRGGEALGDTTRALLKCALRSPQVGTRGARLGGGLGWDCGNGGDCGWPG